MTRLRGRHERVGPLVFADRETIMLATLGDESNGVHAETAITGAGEDDPLVVLLRELLGSRLDHLDAQSEDFLGETPLRRRHRLVSLTRRSPAA